jgi:hypothetical protein
MSSNPLFKINECEKHARSDLDTVTLAVDKSRTDSLKPGCEFKYDYAVDIKGILNEVLKTMGTVNLRL